MEKLKVKSLSSMKKHPSGLELTIYIFILLQKMIRLYLVMLALSTNNFWLFFFLFFSVYFYFLIFFYSSFLTNRHSPAFHNNLSTAFYFLFLFKKYSCSNGPLFCLIKVNPWWMRPFKGWSPIPVVRSCFVQHLEFCDDQACGKAYTMEPVTALNNDF